MKLNHWVVTICLFFIIFTTKAQTITVNIQPNTVSFTDGNDSILNYQIAEKSLNGKYKRANYIHPLFTLDGEVLTEDFPDDHPHHRGVFWAWHQLYIGDKRIGDGWEIRDFSWDVASVKTINKNDSSKTIQADVFWQSNQWLDVNGNKKPFVKETTTITVYPKKDYYRNIDIEISLLALEPNIRIGGSENEKGYGGFSPRIKLPYDVIFTSNKGIVTPENLPIKAGNWMDISGRFGKNGGTAGISILCHNSNPSPTNRWILRSKKSMQNAVYPFPGSKPVALSHKNPTILRYRLTIHKGDAQTIPLDKLYKNYNSAY